MVNSLRGLGGRPDIRSKNDILEELKEFKTFNLSKHLSTMSFGFVGWVGSYKHRTRHIYY